MRNPLASAFNPAFSKPRFSELGVLPIVTRTTSKSIFFSAPAGAEKKMDFEVVLVTIGRTPNSENLGLEKAGLKADAKGFLTVNAQRQTSVPHLYAIGDIAGQLPRNVSNCIKMRNRSLSLCIDSEKPLSVCL